ncbi:hypothetical protein DL546_009353 [Coniochaeta pulveracea]|uniref:Uncharacterized protein n=1 Tax=Coniochaeta pulveracea TaxID=177199 RepID=A0A420YHD8_9PEZI|nr:hypothetical protein DL546_009353 [Coniochaeta pulveracea]
MDNKSKDPLMPLGNDPAPNGDEPAITDTSFTHIDEAPTSRAQSRTPSSRRPSSEALSFSHCPRPSALRYHSSIEDDLRGVDPRSQGPIHGTKRARSGSTDGEETSGEPKPKRDKLLQELDNLEACSHAEAGLRHETEGSAADVASSQSKGQMIVPAPDLGSPLRSMTTENDQRTEMYNSSNSPSPMPAKDVRRYPET